jgi:hypothetical protein
MIWGFFSEERGKISLLYHPIWWLWFPPWRNRRIKLTDHLTGWSRFHSSGKESNRFIETSNWTKFSVLRLCSVGRKENNLYEALTYLFNPFLLYPTMSMFFFFHFDHFTDGRTPWTSDQLVARPLSKHRTTQTQNKHVHIPNIHALCRIRIHDPGFRASEDSTCLMVVFFNHRALIL